MIPSSVGVQAIGTDSMDLVTLCQDCVDLL